MEDPEIDLRAVLGVLRRRMVLIASCVVVGIAIAALALFALRPIYTSTALVLVDPSKKDLLDPNAQATGLSSESARVDSEVELVKTDTNLLLVATALDVVRDPEFGVRLGLVDRLLAFFRLSEPNLASGRESLRNVMQSLSEGVTARRRGLTFLIEVSAQSRRPEFAAQLANTVAQTYIEQQLKAKIDSILESRNAIEDRISDAYEELTQSEAAFEGYFDNNIERIAAATGQSELLALRGSLADALDEGGRLTGVIENSQRLLAASDWTALTRNLEDQALASLESERQDLVSRLNAAATGSEAAEDLRAQLSDIEARLEQDVTERLGSLRSELANIQSEANRVRSELRQSVLTSDLPADILAGIYQIQQNAELARGQYQTLLSRQANLDTQAYLQVADSRIVSQATVPLDPSFPSTRLFVILGALTGLGFGLVLAFLFENFFGGFTSVEQTSSQLRTSTVVALPRQRLPRLPDGSEAPSIADAVIQAPVSGYSESLRRLRISVDQAIAAADLPSTDDERSGKVIVVTSSVPEEGKTSTAIALARTYALGGQTTLLIDADLRKPGIHRHLAIEPSKGLIDYLEAGGVQAELPDIMSTEPESGLQFVLGARPSVGATDRLVSGPTLARLLRAARKRFDIVIVDTSPLGPVVDAVYLARAADVALYLIKWASTPQREVREAIGGLRNAIDPSIPIISVLNNQAAEGGRRGYKYAYYYGSA